MYIKGEETLPFLPHHKLPWVQGGRAYYYWERELLCCRGISNTIFFFFFSILISLLDFVLVTIKFTGSGGVFEAHSAHN